MKPFIGWAFNLRAGCGLVTPIRRTATTATATTATVAPNYFMNCSSLHLLLLLSDRDKKSPRYKTRHSDAAFTSGFEDQYFISISLRDRQSARQHFPRCPFFDCSVRGQSIDPNVRLMEGRDRKSKLFRRKEGRRFLGLSNLSLASVPPSFHTEPACAWLPLFESRSDRIYHSKDLQTPHS